MKILFISLFMFFFNIADANSKSFHDFSVESITGKEIKLSKYKNKVVLLVNTASQCGFTPQYSGLQKIYDRYKEDGFIVLGVPSDDFNQELSTNSDVKKFCEIRYGVNFPMTSIQKIKGNDAHPIYKWIADNVSVIGQPRWNFHKFLIGKDGNIVNWYSSMTSPTSESFVKDVENAIYN
ncbi:MAG: glutathione peroxidase [Rickettsiales bacterium]|nr:glutathione peroxidase [Rickettsiales bacterium]|tara:strand:+ start:399 stop:935 length:537 start_codon:yes stop_codon:yes gene_type:complete